MHHSTAEPCLRDGANREAREREDFQRLWHQPNFVLLNQSKSFHMVENRRCRLKLRFANVHLTCKIGLGEEDRPVSFSQPASQPGQG